MDDAVALARTGNAGLLRPYSAKSRPFEGCNRPNYEAIAAPGVSGKRLALAELAYMQQRDGLEVASSDCSAFLYVFRNAAQTRQGGYTAGAVIVDEHDIEVHTGGLTSGPAFTVHA